MNTGNADFADWMCHQYEEGFEYDMQKRELEKDARIRKPTMIDSPTAYREMREYESSDLANYTKSC